MTEIKLYFYATEIQIEDPERWMSEEEKQRRRRYRDEKKQCEYSVTRRVGREILAVHEGCQPEEISWSAQGIPQVSVRGRACQHQMSVSHGHGIGVIAVKFADRIRMGVDLEIVDRVKKSRAWMALVFTESELLELRENASDEVVFRYWTLKEATLKALREDPVRDPLTLEVDVRNAGIQNYARVSPVEGVGWTFRIMGGLCRDSVGKKPDALLVSVVVLPGDNVLSDPIQTGMWAEDVRIRGFWWNPDEIGHLQVHDLEELSGRLLKIDIESVFKRP